MLSTTKDISTNVSVNVTGESVIDDETVAIYRAHAEREEDPLEINIVIFDRSKYKSDCSKDESNFEEAVYDVEKEVMDKLEEVAGLFKEDESDNSDEGSEDGSDDSGDGKVGAGDEETIVP